MQQYDFSLFQTLHGSVPFRCVSTHPTEPLVALQTSLSVQISQTPTFSQTKIRCAIWNSETCELVSAPEDAVALAWNAEGNEVGMVREDGYQPLITDSGTIRLFNYTWERYSWPERKLLHSCTLQFSTHWPEIIVFSPLGDLAVIQWFEVEKSGLCFINLTRYGDMLLSDADMPLIEREGDVSDEEDTAEDEEEEEDGHFFVETSLTTPPVFSPDGRFIIFCWQKSQRWWTDIPDDVYVEGELPARVGNCHVGYVQIIDLETHTTYSLALFANVPAGWQPSYEGDCSNEWLHEPVFIDDRHFQIQLPTSEIEVYKAV